MFMISLVVLSTLCAECGPKVEPSTSQAIIKVESGGYPYVIGDNTDHKSYKLNSKEAAVNLAASLLSKNHNIDMGLMQINSIHLKPMGLTLDKVFDPCQNIKAGTTILADFYKQHDRPGADKVVVLYKALSAYNTGSAWKGEGYINKILHAAGVGYRVAVNGTIPTTSSRSRGSSKPKATQQAADTHTLTPDGTSLFFKDSYN